MRPQAAHDSAQPRLKKEMANTPAPAWKRLRTAFLEKPTTPRERHMQVGQGSPPHHESELPLAKTARLPSAKPQVPRRPFPPCSSPSRCSPQTTAPQAASCRKSQDSPRSKNPPRPWEWPRRAQQAGAHPASKTDEYQTVPSPTAPRLPPQPLSFPPEPES